MSSPREFNIVVFEGDHCGPEVTREAIKVLQAISTNSSSTSPVRFHFNHQLIGGCSIDTNGQALTDEALSLAKSSDAILLGAVGGPKWGTNSPVRPEQGLLRLRKELNTFGNLRPCNFASKSLVKYSPLKEEVCAGTDFVIVRELTGGIYFGERKEASEENGFEFALDTEPYYKKEIERIVRLAGVLASLSTPPLKVTSLDKANVLATSRLWRRTVDEVMKSEFPNVKYEHQLIDSAAMIMVKNPKALNGIIVTSNLFGDIISDEASVIPGSLGLLPSASLSGIPKLAAQTTGGGGGEKGPNGIYEPIHGSAPDIAGKGIVNPVAAILSAAMMCRYSLGLEKEARVIERSVERVLDSGVRTKDLGGDVRTEEAGDKVKLEVEGYYKGLWNL